MDTGQQTPLGVEDARRYAAALVEKRGARFVYCPDGIGTCANGPILDSSEFDNADDPRAKTGCLVGEILTAHGITLHTEGNFFSSPIQDIFGHRPDLFDDSMDPDEDMPIVIYYLGTLQRYQDSGHPWGVAVEAGDRLLSLSTMRERTEFLNEQIPIHKFAAGDLNTAD